MLWSVIPKPLFIANLSNRLTRPSQNYKKPIEILSLPKEEESKQDKKKFYAFPSADLLNDVPDVTITRYTGESVARFLCSVNIPCEFIKHQIAPQVTTYHFNLNDIKDITKIDKAVKMISARARSTVLQAPSAVADFALTIPNDERRSVFLRELIPYDTRHPSTAAIGINNEGEKMYIDIAKMPHVLIAGATGSGKSVCLNTIICSLLMSAAPSEISFVMIDPKRVELSAYKDIPHLLRPVARGKDEAMEALKYAYELAQWRFEKLERMGLKQAKELGWTTVVVVIDELAELMLTSKYEVEDSIIGIAQIGRAAGVHLIVATQRPTVNVITGLIKENIPCKIALQTSTVHGSISILGEKGAEKLLGKGDALIKLPTQDRPIRCQTAFTADEEISRIAEHCRNAIIEEEI